MLGELRAIVGEHGLNLRAPALHAARQSGRELAPKCTARLKDRTLYQEERFISLNRDGRTGLPGIVEERLASLKLPLAPRNGSHCFERPNNAIQERHLRILASKGRGDIVR